MVLYVIAILFFIMFFVGQSLFKNGIEWQDEELIFSGKLIMYFCFIGAPLSVILYVMTGA